MKKLIIATALVLGIGAASFAAETGKISSGLNLGYAMPMGGAWGDYKASFAMGAFGEYKFHEMFSGGLEFNYDFGHKHKDFSDLKIKMWQLTPYAKATKEFDLAGKKAKGYGLLGMGLYHWSSDAYTVSGVDVASDSGSKFGLNVGGGVSMEVMPQWEVGLDLRYHHVFNMVTNSNGDKEAAKTFTPSVKIIYTF